MVTDDEAQPPVEFGDPQLDETLLRRALLHYVRGMDVPNEQPAAQHSSFQQRGIEVRPYNVRMAKRVAKRAKLPDNGVAVAFTFNNLFTMVVFGIVEDIAKLIPTVGDLIEMGISLVSFYWHRVVLVTDTHVYIYRDLPFHRPGQQLNVFERGPGLVTIGSPKTGWWSKFIRRGQLTFSDGTVVYHGILWIKRARYVAQEGNIAPEH